MKYKMTDETRIVDTHTLHRIVALEDSGNVKAGDLGGWIESSNNLSQDGTAWVYDNAVVYGNALVFGNAKVFDTAMVYDNAVVCDNARVWDNAKVYDDALVCDNIKVCGNAWVFGTTKYQNKLIAIAHASIQALGVLEEMDESANLGIWEARVTRELREALEAYDKACQSPTQGDEWMIVDDEEKWMCDPFYPN